MITGGDASPILLSDDGYTIQRSLRFRSSASAYLDRTPASSANQTTWTWSGWVKRGTLGAEQHIFGCGTAGTNNFQFFFSSTDNLQVNTYIGATTVVVRQTRAVFRDPAAWYHVELVADTNNATQANRMLLYVNGVSQSFATSYALSSGQTFFINTNIAHYSGKYWNTGGYFDGYLAEVNFIDGQALTPSSFGQTDPVTGVWTPKKYTGTYGTNGFYLPFSDNTSATTLAYDKSGNGNNWTPNNISTTAGATYDSMTDVPMLTDANTANFCTLNPVDKTASLTIDQANLHATSSSGWSTCRSSFSVSSGKWYWEVYETNSGGNGIHIGIENSSNVISSQIGQTATSYSFMPSAAVKYNNGVSTSYGSVVASGRTVGVALDLDSGTLTYYDNGASLGTAFTGISGTYSPAISVYPGADLYTNFGQRPFIH